MLKNKALFPGTFDPFTNGHLEILKQALLDYDEVHLIIMLNKNKEPYFTIRKRLAIISEIQEDNLVVGIWESKAIDYCKNNQIHSIVRGYRDDKDFSYEKKLEAHYKKDFPALNIKLYKSFSKISSSMIKEKIKNGTDISDLVPWKVKKWIKED